MSQKIKTSVEIDGSLSASQIANATTDTDKFLVSDNGTIKYRTGSEMLSDLGVVAGTANHVQHQVKAGVAINKGQAVYVTGADGTNMIVGLASNTYESTSSKTMGLLNATVSANGFADVITEGLLAGLDTSTAVAGNPVWLGTNGNLIYGLANKPYAPAHLVFIGIVTRVNANNGEIFVKVQNGFELNEIHDVDLQTTTPINGHLLGYNGTLWVNKTIAGWLGYTPANDAQVVKITGDQTIAGIKEFSNLTRGTSFQLQGSGGGSAALYLKTGNSYSPIGDGYTSLYSLGPYGLTVSSRYYDSQLGSSITKAANFNLSSITYNTERTYSFPDKDGTFAMTSDLSNYVPSTKTITINGTVLDFSSNLSFTIPVGVSTFNNRTGAVTLTSGDVTTALGYTPYNSSNPAGYISSYTETDTLQTVTGRGSTTSYGVGFNNYVNILNQNSIYWYNSGNGSYARTYFDGGTFNLDRSLWVTASIYGDVFYDRNDSGYYVNPASYSRLNQLSIGTVNTSYSLYNNGNSYLNGSVEIDDTLYVSSGYSARAPIFYDYDNTGYYLDPSSQSNLNTVYANSYNLYNGNTIWNSGNDGSGSGLDADLIDGIDSSRIVSGSGASKISSHANANEWRDSGFYENDGGGSNWPGATWYNSINVRHSNQGNYHGFQLAMSYYDNNLWFRSYQGLGTFQTWAKALSTQNYSDYSNFSGAVYGTIYYDANNTGYYLDPASTSNLNTVNASMFNGRITPLNGTSSVIGQVQTSSSINMGIASGNYGYGISTNNAGGLDIMANQTSQPIRFWSGTVNESPTKSADFNGTTVNFYGNTYSYAYRGNGNVGGTGEATWHPAGIYCGSTMWQYGHMYKNNSSIYDIYDGFANSSLRAPIFYDNNNTGYYIDPASSSNINTITAAEYYCNGWFRNNDSNEGLYNTTTTQHWSSNTNGYWDASSTTSVSAIRFYTGGHVTSLRGYVYADSGNNIGFLNNAGGWALRATSSSEVLVYGARFTVNANGNAASYIDMYDGDEGNRSIHCNSNRIGFLNQSDGWGSYCVDNGDWVTDTISWAGASSRAPIFYDSNDSSYYLDPNSNSRLYRMLVHRGIAGGGQNIFNGLESPESANGRGQLVISSSYSDLVIASSQANDQHGSTLSFTAYNPNNVNSYRKFVINQGNWGNRKHMLSFGYSDTEQTNPHNAINGGVNTLTLDGLNRRVGIKKEDPAYPLDVDGIINTASGYISVGNPWGTANSAWFPNGITTPNVTSWIYGTAYIGNAPGNGSGNEINGSGHVISTGNHYANIFYDYYDTAYYLNLNSTSNLWRTKVNAGQGDFTVGGNSDTFYPVSFAFDNSTSAWNANIELEIYRDDVHENGSGYGSFRFIVQGQPSSWGHRAFAITGWKYVTGYGSPYNNPVGDCTAENYGGSIVIWLRGGATYHFINRNVNNYAYLNFGNPSGTGWTGTNGVAYNTKTTQEPALARGNGNFLFGTTNMSETAWISKSTPQLYFNSTSSGRNAYIGIDDTYNMRVTNTTGGNLYLGSGNTVIVENSFQAPILYDYNNTGYYVDPASTSNLNAINLGTTSAKIRWGGSTTPTLGFPFGNSDTGNNIWIEASDSDTGGLAIGNDGVTVWGAGDQGYVFRVIDEDSYQSTNNVSTSTTFYVNQGTSGGAYVKGDFTASGDVIAYSDKKVKENIQTIENALDKVSKLRGVTYNRTDSEDKSEKVGVVAQEIQEILPQVVHEQKDGLLGVSYGNITAVLIEAIKEQQTQIEELKQLVNTLINK